VQLLSPQAESDNVWVRAPITLSASVPLDGVTLREGITLRADGNVLDVDFALSPDGERVSVSIVKPPPSPSTVTLSVTPALKGKNGEAAVESQWAWRLPLWENAPSLPGDGTAGRGVFAMDVDGADRAVVASVDDTGGVQVSRLESTTWTPLGRLAGAAGDVSLIIDNENRPVVLWCEVDAPFLLHAARFVGDGWQTLAAGSASLRASSCARGSTALALTREGRLVVAVAGDAEVTLFGWDGSGWGQIGTRLDLEPHRIVSELALAAHDDEIVAAVGFREGANHDVRVFRAKDGRWQALASNLSLVHGRSATRPSLALGLGDAIHVAWQQQSSSSSNVYVASLDEDAGNWSVIGAAVDLDLDADATSPRLRVDESGVPFVLWIEGTERGRVAYLARSMDGAWQVLGGALAAGELTATSLDLSSRDQPFALVFDDTEVAARLARFNESTTSPFVRGTEGAHACSLPLDGDATFPRTLSATGCYTDLKAGRLVDAFLPYDVNAPLWSDGAAKRRFLSIPAGTHIGFTTTGTWQLPVGTLLVKEFLLHDPTRDRSVIETRFLIKRCEPGACRAAWQGYSYQWNEDGSDAWLLDNDDETHFVDWAVGGSRHRHAYPGRNECVRCHARAAGGALGLQTAQLNRQSSYGTHVANQLSVLDQLGFFGDGPVLEPNQELPRLPRYDDPAFSNVERTRSYFHVNCANCHQPGGRWPVIDFRYEAKLISDPEAPENICNLIVPGDARASSLYIKGAVRHGSIPEGFVGDPMPPIGSVMPDVRQLEVTAAWINAMQTCP
jgi:hypothetical protein